MKNNKDQETKAIVFKYTLKRTPKQEHVETHYVRAFDEDIARTALSDTLNVSPDLLRLGKKNLPYKIRQAIFDKKNKDYYLTLDVEKRPEESKTIEEIQSELFDFGSAQLNLLRYQIKALFSESIELIQEYSKGDDDDKVRDRICKSIRQSIITNKYSNEIFENDITLLDAIDSYQTNFYHEKQVPT